MGTLNRKWRGGHCSFRFWSKVCIHEFLPPAKEMAIYMLTNIESLLLSNLLPSWNMMRCITMCTHFLSGSWWKVFPSLVAWRKLSPLPLPHRIHLLILSWKVTVMKRTWRMMTSYLLDRRKNVAADTIVLMAIWVCLVSFSLDLYAMQDLDLVENILWSAFCEKSNFDKMCCICSTWFVSFAMHG